MCVWDIGSVVMYLTMRWHYLGVPCERKDRQKKKAGGVACYIRNSVPYKRLQNLEDDTHEAVWINSRPRHLPRQFSCIAVGCIYHPPDADNTSMHDYLTNCIDHILRMHPSCGVILTGDFNQLRDLFLRSHYGFKQMVEQPTRQQAILDKIWTNLSPVYDKPIVLSQLGTSDHNMVLFSPSSVPSLDTGHTVKITTKCMGRREKAAFASALRSAPEFPCPRTRTNRFKNSFIPWCLFNQ